MTTYAPNLQRPVWGVFAFILAGLLILAALASTRVVMGGKHGDLHFAEADQARNCLKNYGAWKIYKEPGGAVFHFLCKYPGDETIYDVIVRKVSEGLFEEKTAFSPKGGNWQAIQKWLANKNASFATDLKGPFEFVWQNQP